MTVVVRLAGWLRFSLEAFSVSVMSCGFDLNNLLSESKKRTPFLSIEKQSWLSPSIAYLILSPHASRSLPVALLLISSIGMLFRPSDVLALN